MRNHLLLVNVSFVFMISSVQTQARVEPPTQSNRTLAERMVSIRSQVINLEKNLFDSGNAQIDSKKQIGKIKQLLKLQKLEEGLSQRRLKELEKTVEELEARKAVLAERLQIQQRMIRNSLRVLKTEFQGSTNLSFENLGRGFRLAELEKLEAPRRRVTEKLVDLGLKEIEVLKVDLADAEQLEHKIQEEKSQLNYLMQNLKEQEGVLEFNQRLQADIIHNRSVQRMEQLQKYHRLKSAEAQVENMLRDFNAHRELEKNIDAERKVSKAMMVGDFYKKKGQLPFPVIGGQVVSSFGRMFDPKSGLYVFKKGVDIISRDQQSVRAISSGKVAYAGQLPNYGQVIILDHGDHYYSLCAHLGKILKKSNEFVQVGDLIGKTGDSNTPLYFEIRARNVAVNPLQWIMN